MHVDSVTRYPTRDHIEPLGLGGLNVMANKVIVCQVCNRDKGVLTLRQFYATLLQADDDRAATVLRFIKARAVAPVCMSGDALSADQAASIMRTLTDEAQAAAAGFGLNIAICSVVVHGEQVRAYTSPFEADSLQSLAVAHQLSEQSRLLVDQAPATAAQLLEAAE